MDKKGRLEEHSKEKLLVYENYLKLYLNIMCNTAYRSIHIWEPFAGKGKDEKGNEGSAFIAMEIINDYRKKYSKNIFLYLNDNDKNNVTSLKQISKKHNYQKFTEIYNDNANDFLETVNTVLKKEQKVHNLFFIDPWGYTQYTSDNLTKLLQLINTDYLIFIPTSNIYRFKKVEGKPARKFVLDLGINEEQRSQNNEVSFIENLKNCLKGKAKSKFVYDYKLTNKKVVNSFFHLFFITKNVYGAEKFLEAIEKVKKIVEQEDLLFDIKKMSLEKFLKEYLERERTNKEIYKITIEKGFLPSKVNNILKEWEQDNKLEFEGERKKGSFYLKEDRKIKIKFKEYQEGKLF